MAAERLARLAVTFFPAILLTVRVGSAAESLVAEGRSDDISVARGLTRRDDDARLQDLAPEEGLIRLLGHGELQLRGNVLAPLTFDATPSYANAHPGATLQPLGQRAYGTQWLRLRPTLQIGKSARVVTQADVFGGLVVGGLTTDVNGDTTPRDAFDSIGAAELRWAYLEWITPVGLLRVGRQPSHWGLGLVANDGDHRPLFGDYRKGTVGDRIGFATKPLGRESPFVLALAGDLVRRDTFASEARGDRTMQAVFALLWQGELLEAGAYGAVRRQENQRASIPEVAEYTDRLEAVVVDAYVRAVGRVLPEIDAFFGAEAAVTNATSDFPRTAQQLREGRRTSIRGLGVIAEAGVQSGTVAQEGLRPRSRWVAKLEYGYASGQADPFAPTQTRFSFDPNHRAGRLLFDELLRFQTARAATAIQDPYLVAEARPIPGIDLLPTNGAVCGASYLNPTFVFRPDASIDLAFGIVVAQATSDVVDPYRLASAGSYVNYRGGSARGRDLGVEIDLAVEKRWVASSGLVPQLGFQGAVLAPGTAFADAKGNTIAPPWLIEGRAGLQF